MKIEGLKILDSNFYHQIIIGDRKMIVQRYDRHGVLDTKDDGPVRVKSTDAISKRIKGKDDDEVKALVLDYFLSYNKISAILEDASIQWNFYPLLVDSSLGKKLIFKDNLSKDLCDKVRSKYCFDRLEFLVNLDSCSDFTFNTGMGNSYYKMAQDSDNKAIFGLSTYYDDKKRLQVRKEELDFLAKAIDIIMEGNIIDVVGTCSNDRMGFSGEFVILDKEREDKVIHISKELVTFASPFVGKHNLNVFSQRREEEKNEGKVYQMKMEEF
ncbi:MAG: hypothetical protein PUC82_03650 [bacterium]|nr:hypothetical protein [bacterium]